MGSPNIATKAEALTRIKSLTRMTMVGFELLVKMSQVNYRDSDHYLNGVVFLSHIVLPSIINA